MPVHRDETRNDDVRHYADDEAASQCAGIVLGDSTGSIYKLESVQR